MQFRLIYQGDLKAAGNNNKRVEDKWNVRNALSPQLEELWQQHPSLHSGPGFVEDEQYGPDGRLLKFDPDINKRVNARHAAKIRVPVLMGGHSFLPLVRQS